MAEGPGAEKFIGRSHELRQVCATFDDATRGQGRLVVVSGGAGLGKTRFCEEVTDRAQREGLATAWGRGWTDDGAPPLWPWQSVLATLCAPDGADLLDGDPGRATVDPERFSRFVAVADLLASACARTPACIVIDDLHAADPGALLLTRFLARGVRRLPLVLVVTRRTGEGDTAVVELLDELEQEAMLVMLGHLDLHETEAFLASAGHSGVDPDLVLAVLRVSGGNPLFLHKLVALGLDRDLPNGLRRAIDENLDRLAATDRRVLTAGAVLGPTPTVGETAAVTGTSPAAVVEALDHGTRAGLVTVVDSTGYVFTHDLVRQALIDSVSSIDRLDLHARAADAVAPHDADVPPDQLARRAHHALGAASRSTDDARRAVDASRAAARAMVRDFGYERAAELLGAAAGLHASAGLGPAPAALLVEWAEAVLRSGWLAQARELFDQAAEAADREGDPVILAEASLGLGGVWLNERRDPTDRARVLGLQQRARDALPTGERRLGARLEMRLAAEAAYDGAPLDLALDALEAVRRLDDGRALAEALSLCQHAMLVPEHTRARLAMADELVRVASASGAGMLALMGLCFRAVDLFQLGDPRAERALADVRARTDALGVRSIGYIVDVLGVMVAIRSGHLDDAEAAAQRCYQLGLEVGDADALACLGAHLVMIGWLRGQDHEILALVEEVADSPTLIAAEFSFRAGRARLAACAGHLDAARALLDRVVGDGPTTLPRSSNWLTGMLIITDTARMLGDDKIARETYDLLQPFADLCITPSMAVVDFGSAEWALGMAAATFGDLDAAVDHLERAVAVNRRLGNRPMLAVTAATLAEELGRRDRPGDRGRAVSAFDTAIAEARAIGMKVRADQWSAAKSRLGVRESDRVGTLRHDGRHWTLSLDDHHVVVGDRLGMRYLARLMSQPGVPIPALTLAGTGEVLVGSAPQPVLDATAQADYARRAHELTADLAEAEDHADLVRAERLRVELDTLVEEVERATGLAGRSRSFTDSGERARTAVRKAIKRVIDEIEAADGELGSLLRDTVTTGARCCYDPDPDPDHRVSWQTTTV